MYNKSENWSDNFSKTLLAKSADYKIPLCTHGTGTNDTKALYKCIYWMGNEEQTRLRHSKSQWQEAKPG